MSRTSGPRFTEAHLDLVLTFLEDNLPGEMPNALMSELTKFLVEEGVVSKSVDTNPETSEFIHDYGSDDEFSDSDDDCHSDCSASSAPTPRVKPKSPKKRVKGTGK